MGLPGANGIEHAIQAVAGLAFWIARPLTCMRRQGNRLGVAGSQRIGYASVMTQASDQLASRFRRAMLYVIEELGEVGTTKLQKILYLADLEHFHATGTTLTGARWVRYTYGPMAKALVPSTIAMDGHEVSVSIETAGPYGTRVFRPGPAPRFRPALAAVERGALDAIIALTRELSATETIQLAYNTSPMRALLRLEVGREPMLDVEIPFDLDEGLVREITGPTMTSKTPEQIASFKRQELKRAADLVDAAAAS